MEIVAELGIPLQLVTGLAGLAAAVVAAHGLRTRRPRRARVAALGMGAWGATYMALLLAASLTSDETVLGRNQPKHFCGFYLDCHAMVVLERVQRLRAIGDGPMTEAQGQFFVVTVRQQSDAQRARIGLASPRSEVIDAAGRRFAVSSAGQAALELVEGSQPPLGRAIEPEESYTTQLVFDLPLDIRDPKLHVYEASMLARLSELFLIGDEDSMLHRKTVFALN